MKRRSVVALGIVAALGASSAFAQIASQAADGQSCSDTQQTVAPRADTQSVATAGGSVVFVDPKTRKVRRPNAAEIGRLLGPPAARAVKRRALTTKAGPGGAVGVVLDDSFDSYTIVTKNPDGKLAMDCVTGAEKAAAAVSAGAKGARKDGAPGTLDVE